MKKLPLVLVCAFLTSGIAIAQKSAVSQAEKYLRDLEPNYTSARNAVKPALTNAETKDDARTWYVAGKAEFGAYDQMLGKRQIDPKSVKALDMANAIYDGNKYLKTALPLDTVYIVDKKTGAPKINKKDGKQEYKVKYSKEIKGILSGHMNDFSEAGSTFYDAKDYAKAYECWGEFCEYAKATKGVKDVVAVPDSIIGQLYFYQGIAAYQDQKYKDAIKSFETARNFDYDTKDTYDYALACYATLDDNEGIIETAKIAFPKYGSEDSQYVSVLINDYINREDYDGALTMLDKAIALNPTKAEFYDVKGTVCEQKEDLENAFKNFKKSIEVDPNYAKGQFNVGRYYYNLAVKKNEAAPKEYTVRQYNEYFTKEVKPYYEQARPYIEKANQLDPDNSEIKYALSNLYYQLGLEQ